MSVTDPSMGLTLPPLSEAAALRGHLRALAGMIKALARPLDLDELFRAAHTETARAVDAQTFVLGALPRGDSNRRGRAPDRLRRRAHRRDFSHSAVA